MKRRLSMTALLCALALAAPAQEPKKQSDAEKQMAAEMAMGEPAPEHARLAALEGKWNVTARWWPAPGKQPMEFGGTAVNHMILGGRFLESRTVTKSDATYESLAVFGFDRRKGEYTMVGFDSMGTYSITAAGVWDEKTSSIALSGAEAEPGAKSAMRYRMRIRAVTKDEYRMTMSFFLPDGTEWTAVESIYTRAGGRS